VAAANFVGKLVFFTLKALVISLNIFVGYKWIEGAFNGEQVEGEAEQEADVQFAAPLALIGLGTYMIVGSFTDLFEMTADTILLCFCEDKKANEGKVMLAPDSLLKALGMYKKNMKEKKKVDDHSDDENQTTMEMSEFGSGNDAFKE
jgi:hypothetical protein